MHPSNRMYELALTAPLYDTNPVPGRAVAGLPDYIRKELKKLKSSDVQQVPPWLEKNKGKMVG